MYNGGMFMVSILVALFAAAVFCGSVSLRPDELSVSELERRAKRSDAYALRLRRQYNLASLIVMTRLGSWLFLILFVVSAGVWFGWLEGFLLSVAAAAVYPVCTKSGVLSRLSTRLYQKIEGKLLAAAEKAPKVWRFFYGRIPDALGSERQFSSREELEDALAGSTSILSDDERRMVTNSLAFKSKRVHEVMTPRSVMQTVKKEEFIGPLVLSELHELGHSRLPVVDGDVHNVVGVLHLRSLLSLDEKQSQSAEELMEKRVFYIHEDDSLQKTLNAFISKRSHLFVVVNSQRETVGLVTLEDVMEALIGKKIVDEDDVHEDLRALAKEKGKKNNNSPHGVYL